MPGLVIARRRWTIGSDDFFIPGFVFALLHFIWTLIYCVISSRNYNNNHNNTFWLLDDDCNAQLTYHAFGQLVLNFGCLILELCIVKVSFQGSILNFHARHQLANLLYIWFILLVIELVWDIYGLIIFNQLNKNSLACSFTTKETIFALKLFNLLIWLLLPFLIWCVYDPAGRSWVKMRKFQLSMKEPNCKYHYRRSNNSNRNWRYREALREYEQSWINRCRMFCCFLSINRDRKDNSLTQIAKLLSEFFRDLDVVPSDVVAGLSLMRVQQKVMQNETLSESNHKTFQFLSAIPITSETEFLDLTHPLVMKEVCNLIHYLHYSLAIYGWPMYMMSNAPSKWCKLLNHIKCCGNCRFGCPSSSLIRCSSAFMHSNIEPDTIVDGLDNDTSLQDLHISGDNCCLCNRAAVQQTCINHNYKIIYITYYNQPEKPPFFVAVDFDKMSIVISVRGTLSLYDVLTDLNAEYETLPIHPTKDDWFGHKGMVAAANYIRIKLREKLIIERANEELKSKNLRPRKQQYPIICLGHSLGAGTAAILSIILRQTYKENVICMAFAPPGGLLSEELANYSKDFIVSVVLGKDIVPRLGLHQMEKLRFDLIQSIKYCEMPKWKIIFKSCCRETNKISSEDYVRKFKIDWSNVKAKLMIPEDDMNLSMHPNDESISLTVHTPLYPPGSIIHLVRVHPSKKDFQYGSKWRRFFCKKLTIVQALWSNFKNFDEIIISPSMIKDHMPDEMLEALQNLVSNTGPPKPRRNVSPNSSKGQSSSSSGLESLASSPHFNVLIETSFTDGALIIDPNTTTNIVDDAHTSELYTGERLKRLRSLIRKRRAPLAMPEEISLTDCGGTETTDQRSMPKMIKRKSMDSVEDMLKDLFYGLLLVFLMAELFIIGQIIGATDFDSNYLFCKWKLIAGSAWKVLEGFHEGQTQIDSSGGSQTLACWSHPIDLHLVTRGIQGWPKIVLEVWRRDRLDQCSVIGYGVISVPSQPGQHRICCHTWQPLGSLTDKLATLFNGETVQLAEQWLVYSAEQRHRLQTQNMGIVQLEFNLIFRDFEKFGVETN